MEQINSDVMAADHVFDLNKDGSKLSTRMSLIKEVNNDMCHNYYWLCKVRVVSDNRVFRSHFVLWFDIFEVMDYFDVDGVTKKQIREYANEIAGNMIGNLGRDGKFTRTDWKDFVYWCNETINSYNN